MTTLVVTNDFPPRLGGIETFVRSTVDWLDGDVVVLTGRTPGRRADEERYDAAQPFRVVRRGGVLLPTRRAGAIAARLLRETGATRVLYGAAAPLGLLGPTLAAAGARRQVGLTHGHEAWWARLPGFRSALRRIGDDLTHLTVVSAATGAVIGSALSPAARARLRVLRPAVDLGRFPLARRPGATGVVLVVARLVPRKGVDTLIRAVGRLPEARLIVVGDGPQRARLTRLADRCAAGRVRFAGAVDADELRAAYEAADVFALPCRDRRRGLEVEGLGIVCLEAAATGLPVVVGRSGGAPETVEDEVTGFVVDDLDALTARLRELLDDPALATRMGAAGRSRVESEFSVARSRAVLRDALGLAAGDVRD